MTANLSNWQLVAVAIICYGAIVGAVIGGTR